VDGVEVTDPVEVRELALGDGDVTEVGERGRLEVEGADIGWLCGRECYRRRATHKAPGRHGPGGGGGGPPGGLGGGGGGGVPETVSLVNN